MKNFGDRVRESRKGARLTQKQLAQKVGMSQANLSEIETGLVPSSTYTAQLAAALGVNALWLAEGKGQMASGAPFSVSEPPASSYEIDPMARLVHILEEILPLPEQRDKVLALVREKQAETQAVIKWAKKQVSSHSEASDSQFERKSMYGESAQKKKQGDKND